VARKVYWHEIGLSLVEPTRYKPTASVQVAGHPGGAVHGITLSRVATDVVIRGWELKRLSYWEKLMRDLTLSACINRPVQLDYRSAIWVRRFISGLPESVQQELRRIQCWQQIRRGKFRSPEPEHGHLAHLIASGDWAIDIGANVGHYTARLSELVGSAGRVVAFEPVTATFEILAANIKHFAYSNVTLINAAVADRTGVCGMIVPNWSYGGRNYYRAHLTEGRAAFDVLCVSVDAFAFPQRVSLIKIDVEGAVLPVLHGARGLIARDRPILIIESDLKDVQSFLAPLGYRAWKYSGSPNFVFATNWATYEGEPESVGTSDMPPNGLSAVYGHSGMFSDVEPRGGKR